jgi:methionyl-tRNA formyltransferase
LIHVLCPQDHPVNARVEEWVGTHAGAQLKRSREHLTGGDFLFLISCSEIISKEIRDRYGHVLVIHASDLPKDRGWSPHVWAILDGGNELTVSLLECADPVDSGDIWHQERIALTGIETFDEINALLFDAELRLMDWALERRDDVRPRPQEGEPNYRRKRTPADSRVEPEQSIAEIFDLLRVCDPNRYPVFFEHRGAKYALSIRRVDDSS